MPSAVSVPVAPPAFTLTFGGVDFRLNPSSSNDTTAQVSFQTNEDGVFVNLQSFTGTLKVVPASPNADVTTNKNITSAKVEEEPVSPANATTPAASNGARSGISPTQKQLPFTKVAAVTVKKAPASVKVCSFILIIVKYLPILSFSLFVLINA